MEAEADRPVRKTGAMIGPLLAAIADHHRSRPDRAALPMLEQVLAVLDADPPIDEIQAAPLGVTRHLAAIAAPEGRDPVGRIVREFLAVAHRLPWRQTAGYLDVLSAEYLANYGYVQLVGPGSIVEHHEVRVGIGLWGPDLHYPMHRHEAEELYDVLHGTPEFRTDTTDFAPSSVGAAIHHPPWTPHAQRFGSEPTLLLYAWTGAVVADAELID